MTGEATARRQGQRGVDVGPLHRPVAGDVGVDDGGDAGVLEAAGEIDGGDAAGLRPALDGDLAVAGVDADGDAPGKGAAGLVHQRPGSLTAAVPRMTRLTPSSSQRAMVAMSRMPPPSCTGMPAAATMAATAAAFTGRPAKAPLRSTTWSQRQPAAANSRACAAGSALKTVAVAISPRTRRTQAPSFRSMAG